MSPSKASRTKESLVPLATLIGRELRSEKLEKPLLIYGQAALAKKGEDFFLIKTDCERVPGDPSSAFSVFGIFDGHNGNSAAIYTKERLLDNVVSAIPQGASREEWLQALPRALVAGFVKTDIEFQQKGETSGTTVTFVIIDGWTITVGSVGDSRCILDTQGGVVSLLTVDHRLEENVEERERVTASGGEVGRLNVFGGNEVGPLRCWPGGLCLSRSIGDTDVGEYIVPIPHVKQVKLSDAGGRLIIASDGIWDILSSDMAAKACRGLSAELAAKQFAQKKNALNPYFWQMIREIVKFKEDVLRYIEELEANPDIDRSETLGEFLNARGYSEMFQKAYLVPICGSIWSCPSDGVLSFSAYSVLSFCCNHHLLQIFGRPQWLSVAGRSQTYVAKVRAELERLGCKIRTSCDIKSVLTSDDGRVTVTSGDGSEEVFDKCILAMHAPDALRLLGEQVTFDETRVLGAFRYVYSDIYLHHDTDLMPRNQAAWSAWNFLGSTEKKVCVTYWLNILQNLGEDREPFFVTLNPDQTPKKTLLKWTTGHPVPSVAALTASQELHKIQGKRNIWFCGAYQGYGFHEDGLKAGMAAARGLLGKEAALLDNPRHMVPSLTETGARLFVTRFLGQFISTGCVTILEEGGTMFNLKGKDPTCPLKSVLKIHSPQFYWKVMTQADLGLADAYINGDFSFVDRDSGLLNFMMILIANRDLSSPKSNLAKKRGWWTPMFLTAGVASAKYFLKHVSRQNTLTQARRNISRHYDLSNELFGLFLDDTMTYSSAVFKSDDEILRAAQMRKISLLIDKARVEKHHEVLEIGCGWGTLAIEVVRRTGCRYTGITLSIEQLKYAEDKVKEAGLEDRITFKLCDYRQLSDAHKYDRIISCEMLEAVGHEFMEMFFSRCEAALAENGLMVLQFISIPEERYNEYRLSSDFIKEYIFPGGCLPSLARVTSAMSSSSRLCIEHVENIGIHYYQTLRMWRKNFLDRQKPIMALGFDDKFIRTWEYYFDYCAAGFKTLTLGNYQVVFSRPGNVAAFADSYKGFPSAYYVA